MSRLESEIKAQPLSMQDASTVMNETKSLQVQLQSLVRVNERLKQDSEDRVKKVEDFRKKVFQNIFFCFPKLYSNFINAIYTNVKMLMFQLYDLCTTFTIVERYNDMIRFLKMDSYMIPQNPFSAKELENWMKASNLFVHLHISELVILSLN